MKNKKIFDKYSWFLISVLIFITIWIIIVELFTENISSKIDNDWPEIYKEKTEWQKIECSNIFNEYQSRLDHYSNLIVNSNDLKYSLKNNDAKKIFTSYVKLKLPEDIYCEIYDRKFNMVFFSDRELQPELYLLQRCLTGRKFSYIKNIGFYTYILIFTPIQDATADSEVYGICVTASLVDLTFRIKDKLFPGFGITNEIKNKLGASSPRIITSESIELSSIQEKGSDKFFSLIKGIDGSVVGAVVIDQYDKQTYLLEVKATASKFVSLLVFLFTLGLILLFYRLIKFISSDGVEFLKVLLFFVLIVVVRFIWLIFKFPSEIIKTDIFNPQYYASGALFGTVKSLGEFFITCLMFLAWVIYVAKVFSTNENIYGKKEKKVFPFIKEIFIQVILILCFFLTLFLFGTVFKSIINDSNIKFLDKSNFLPSEGLFFINIIFLLITFITVFFSCSLIIISYFRIRNILSLYSIKKYLFIFLFSIIFIVNIALNTFLNFNISLILRIFFITIVFISGYYIIRDFYSKRNLKLFTLRNFYILILASIILMPLILLHNLKLKESEYIESLSKSITKQEEERAIIILSNELHSINTDKSLENLIFDKTKLPGLAFKLWSEGRLSNENFSSAIIIIDTNKKIISDFNTNPLKFEADSIVSYAVNKFISKPYIYSPPDYLEDITEEQSDIENVDYDFYPVMFEDVTIFRNPDEKYYLGITSIEKSQYKNTPQAKLLGYVIVVLQSDLKNWVSQQPQIFRVQEKDNLLYKLLSKPIISEYVNSEIESTTDMEIAYELKNIIPEFSKYAYNSKRKNLWQTITINDEDYKTYLFLTEPKNIDDIKLKNVERVFAISVKDKDIGIYLFYFLKFILINILLYIFFYLLSAIIVSYKLKNLKFNFRNKLFFIFLLISIIPIIILGFYTRAFIINKYDTSTQSQVLSDLSLVSEVLSSNKEYPHNIKLIPDTTGKRFKSALERYFIKTDKNFNVFINNKLVSTTSEELYKADLLSRRLDADAYYNLVVLKKDSFFKNRHIGAITFFEGYMPIFDVGNKISAIISSVTLFRQNEINEELTETLTFIFGSYVIVVILLLMLVTFFTERLSKPIMILKEATERVARSERDVKIDIKRNDELGVLVDSFNKMIKDLEISKEKERKAEREAAWRDIARRVAHEIKNPLTPIKLSIQHLSNVFKSSKNKEELQQTVEKTKEIIIKEIDKLNRIATEFSDFAKMPSRKYELLNINEIIDEVIVLYSFDEKIKVIKNLTPEIPPIKGDKQEINRIFQNLIKNAFQAISDSGTITVNSYFDDKFVYIEVIDTGCGIEESILKKLFEPNFSTKSTGMGLGLTITKKSLDDMKATIKIESKVNYGTKVIIKFHIHKIDNENKK